MITAIAPARTAAPLAALLPARRRTAWTVEPATHYGIRPNAALSRITDGTRTLLIAESAGVVEVFVVQVDVFPAVPAAVVDANGPDPVAALAARILRSVLPDLDKATANATLVAHGWQQAVIDTAQEMNEVAYELIDHGAHLVVEPRTDGVGIHWQAPSTGGEWSLCAVGNGSVILGYEGPVSGLYGLLTAVLPTAEGRESTDVGSPFTRHLTDRFPQLRPVDSHEAEFGAKGEPHGFIALPTSDEPTDVMDDSRRVAAQFHLFGADLLLSAVTHLV
ncbi:hypothetical protein ACIBAC_00685 [Streptomyces sp. NPDC051362]|uniref:hypothetical protein n=1 Tax=Streptomyces sp. NPDC051362 TaxID=3365651 RepID=UPI0037B3399E